MKSLTGRTSVKVRNQKKRKEEKEKFLFLFKKTNKQGRGVIISNVFTRPRIETQKILDWLLFHLDSNSLQKT